MSCCSEEPILLVSEVNSKLNRQPALAISSARAKFYLLYLRCTLIPTQTGYMPPSTRISMRNIIKLLCEPRQRALVYVRNSVRPMFVILCVFTVSHSGFRNKIIKQLFLLTLRIVYNHRHRHHTQTHKH